MICCKQQAKTKSNARLRKPLSTPRRSRVAHCTRSAVNQQSTPLGVLMWTFRFGWRGKTRVTMVVTIGGRPLPPRILLSTRHDVAKRCSVDFHSDPLLRKFSIFAKCSICSSVQFVRFLFCMTSEKSIALNTDLILWSIGVNDFESSAVLFFLTLIVCCLQKGDFKTLIKFTKINEF